MTLLLISLLLQPPSLECGLGDSITVDYDIPQGYRPLPLEAESSDFALLEQTGDSILIITLNLDTLQLPPMRAAGYDSSRTEFPPPVLVVGRTMPDTVWTVPVFSSPIAVDIPAGFPGDYLDRHAFWIKWSRAPGVWYLYAIAGFLVLAALFIWFLLRRRKRAGVKTDTDPMRHSGLSPEDEALKLLESREFAEGKWQEFYRLVDDMLRNTVSAGFGITNRALTWNQIRRRLSGMKGGSDFIERTRELTREIVLQRYADWGSSRDRARRFVKTLAAVRKEWHRR